MSKTNASVEGIAAKTGAFYAKGERKTISHACYVFSPSELHRFVTRIDHMPGGPRAAAFATLNRLGYTYAGGVLWKPPIGPAPDFNAPNHKAMHAQLLQLLGVNSHEAAVAEIGLLHRLSDEFSDAAMLAVWGCAITLANNVCVRRSDDENDIDGDTTRIDEASQCAQEIRAWMGCSEGYMADMRAMLADMADRAADGPPAVPA